MKPLVITASFLSLWLTGTACAVERFGELPERFWAETDLRYWQSTYLPGVTPIASEEGHWIATLTLGWRRFFWSAPFNLSPEPWLSQPAYPNQRMQLFGDAFSLGYLIHPHLAITLGERYAGERFGGSIEPPRTNYTTLSARMDWPLEDSKLALRGAVTAGYGRTLHSHSGRVHTSLEMGVTYPLIAATRIQLGYKAEWLELAQPLDTGGTWHATGPWGEGRSRQSGVYTGIILSF